MAPTSSRECAFCKQALPVRPVMALRLPASSPVVDFGPKQDLAFCSGRCAYLFGYFAALEAERGGKARGGSP